MSEEIVQHNTHLNPELLGKQELQRFEYFEADLKAHRQAARQEGQPTLAPLFPGDGEFDPPTILVLHASVGSGHRSAAIGIGQALEDLRDSGAAAFPDGSPLPPNTRVLVLDILEWGEHVFDGNFTASSFTGVTRPYYDITWRYTFTGRLLWGQGTFLNLLLWRKFTRYIARVRPLAVIATHIMGANMAAGARMLTGQNFPLVCVPTDYETEGLWPHQAADCFCVGTESMAETLRARRIAENRIALTGIPIRLDFSHVHNSDATREKIGLPTDKKLVLILAGAKLAQPYVNFRETLEAALPTFGTMQQMHFALVCGKDEAYSSHVRMLVEEQKLTNVTVFDYVNEMAALMAASDAVVCKSGGLTVTECLCAQTPMILVGRAYGQEKVNVNMLTSEGAAMHVTTARELVAALISMIKHPERLQAMVMNAGLLRRPNAARDIARITLELTTLPEDATRHVRLKHKWPFVLYIGDRPAHTR